MPAIGFLEELSDMIRRLLVFSTVLVAFLSLISAPAFADHGVAHNGETADVSKTDGLVQDEVVAVTGHGYEPGATLTVVQCFIFPATGPADCELSNYGQYTAEVGADGSASIDYAVNVVEGRCDATTPCFIVVSDGIGPAANAVGTEVTFAEGAPATTTAPTTTAAPATTTALPATTTAAPATTTAPPATTTAAPATTTAAPATTAAPVEADTATDDEGDSEAAAGNDETETDGGGLPGWVIPLAIAAVVVGAALASRNASRKKK